MLDLLDVRSGYGETQVLHGLSLAARPGRVLAGLGRNGAGKSTTLKTIMGLLPCRGGEIRLDGAPIAKRPFDVARDGIAYVPETRDIFPSLTVRANLDLAGRERGDGRLSGCSSCFRAWASGWRMAARSSRAASSRCWQSRGRC